MAKSARLPIVVVATAATLMASPAFAASSAVTAATAKVQLTRPLMLTATQNLDFGTVLLSAVVAGNTYTVRLVPNGALTCSSGVTCAATGKPAIFNVQMSNNQNGQGNGQNGQGNGQNGQGNNQKNLHPCRGQQFYQWDYYSSDHTEPVCQFCSVEQLRRAWS
jgi:hypothetical protein